MLFPGILADGSLIATAASIRTSLGLGTADNPTFGNVTVTSLGIGAAATQALTVNGGANFTNANNTFLTANNVIGLHSNGFLYIQGGTAGLNLNGNSNRAYGVVIDPVATNVRIFTANNDRVIVNSSGDVGVGTGSTISALIHGIKTTEQQRLGYDVNNYFSTTVSSAGATTLSGVSGGVANSGTFAFNGRLTIGPATLSGSSITSNFLNVTGTLPSSLSDTTIGVSYTITGAGSSSQQLGALRVVLAAGYTGNSYCISTQILNSSAGTGASSMLLGEANYGIYGQAVATTVGTNIGAALEGGLGNRNIGFMGVATRAKNSATNVGVFGVGLNTGSTPIHVGGYFGLHSAYPTFASAALIADNGATTSPIFLARDNGTTVFSIIDGGTTTLSDLSSTSAVRERASWSVEAIDNTDATRKYRSIYSAYDTASREFLRGWGDGSKGRIAVAAPASAPTDAHIAASQISFYLDESGHNIKVRVLYADGTTFKTGTLALT